MPLTFEQSPTRNQGNCWDSVPIAKEAAIFVTGNQILGAFRICSTLDENLREQHVPLFI